MKLATFLSAINGSVLILASTTSLASEQSEGLQTAIDQHTGTIQRFQEHHPEKTIPAGLLHSRDVLEAIQVGERPHPDMARPERPDLPDIAMRPELPERAMGQGRPDLPNRPDKPNNGRQ